jgi:hypothetical protein
MKGIYKECTLWKKEICPKKDFLNLPGYKSSQTNHIHGLDDSLLASLNNACAECNFPLVIKNKECPVCGNKNLRLGITEGQRGLNLIFNYNCEECGRILYSEERFD